VAARDACDNKMTCRMAEQLPLDLPHLPQLDDGDFLESACNEAAVAAIEQWPDWTERLVALVGPKGSGKSHLARIWARRAGARVLGGDEMRQLFPQDWPAILLLEDADRNPPDEAAFFHLINRVRLEQGTLLMTAERPPAHWPVATPDLASRLRLATVLTIDPPDDAFLRALLVKLFLDRQMALSTGLIEYVLPRMERSFEAAQRLVADIDRISLARGIKPGRALAAEILEKQLQ
jgi:chromosomal replication initiation ATPase DnaA